MNPKFLCGALALSFESYNSALWLFISSTVFRKISHSHELKETKSVHPMIFRTEIFIIVKSLE
jgi:hypothetical protein